MQYTINFDMKGQFRLEKDLNSKEKHIIIKRKYCKSENAYTSFSKQSYITNERIV